MKLINTNLTVLFLSNLLLGQNKLLTHHVVAVQFVLRRLSKLMMR